MTISIIAAMSKNGVIGKNNTLPWKIHSDLARFKKITTGHIVVMGRKTFDSIGRKLPNRVNVVMTRQSDFKPDGVVVCSSVQDVLSFLDGKDAFILGGEQIYKQFEDIANAMFLTVVDADVEGDAFFGLDLNKWILKSEENKDKDDKDEYSTSFRIYDRK